MSCLFVHSYTMTKWYGFGNKHILLSNCLYCCFAWRFSNSCQLFSLSNHRPSQHGADLLSLLSKLLDENTKPGETKNHSSVVIVSLALQALEELCKAEVCVIDIEEHKRNANPCDQLGLRHNYPPRKS